MRGLHERFSGLLHGLIALITVWLIATSPWLTLYHRLPEPVGALNLSHVLLGLALLPVALLYLAACTLGGRWRIYFPWIAGEIGGVRSDIAAIFRRERPGAEGAGLFAVIEGLLLLAVLTACLSGAAWFALQGTEAALTIRAVHQVAARAIGVVLVAHVIAVSLHVVDLVRD